MKNIFALLFLMVLSTTYSLSQDSTFVPGYYIIEEGALYTVVQAGGGDYEYYDDCYWQKTGLLMKQGEVVIAFEFTKGIYYCFDPQGRMLAFKGKASLTKAPLKPGSGVGYMTETIQLIDGSELSEGSYFWIIGQDLVTSTITIQVQGGATYSIPQAKITLFTVLLKNVVKDSYFGTAEE
jgi:hypothetical protein